jgi:predicted PurR-regulated permease PerM
MIFKTKLARFMREILHKKNYKNIIIVLSLVLLFFLFFGNYNLVYIEPLNNLESEVDRINAIRKNGKKYENNLDNNTKQLKNVEDNKLYKESFVENMINCHKTNNTVSSLGTATNPNHTIHQQCELQNLLEHKNKDNKKIKI